MNETTPNSKIDWSGKTVKQKRKYFYWLAYYLVILGTMVGTLIVTHFWLSIHA